MLQLKKNEGTDKKGQPYLFYTAVLLDDKANVLRMNLSNEFATHTADVNKLSKLQEAQVTIDLNINQTGFNLRGTIVNMTA